MKHYISPLFVWIVVSLLVWTCTRKNLLEIVKTNFQEEVSTSTNLTFKFNKPIAQNITLNRWDTTQYIKFTPHIQGKFQWTSATELVFSPETPLMPSTDYQATPQKSLLNLQNTEGKKSDLSLNEQSKIVFHTQYLNIQNANLFWTSDNNKNKILRVRLNFNYKIDPKNTQSLINASVENKIITTFKVLTNEPDNTLDIWIEQPAQEDWQGKNITINIKEGLKCAESNFITKKPLQKITEIPFTKNLSIESAIGEFQNDKSVMVITTNQSISGNAAEWGNEIELTPKIPYTIKNNENGFLLEGRFQQNTTYQLKIKKDLKGVFGKLNEDFLQSVTFGKIKPTIKFVSEKAVYLSKKGNKNIGIQITGIPSVQVKIYKIYENNLLYFLKRNIYNSYYESNFDADPDEFGDVIINRRYETKTLPIVNDFRVLNLDLDEMSDVKGVYLVSVEDINQLYLRDRKMVAISDIGMIVKESKEDLMVFTNGLADAKALKSAKVSVFSKSNQVIERAETDDNGVAIFKGIKKRFPEASIHLITAMKEKDFNYLYFAQSKIDDASFETGGYKPESNYQAFLYGERNLYRPNETLNFNVVVRNQQWETQAKMPVIFELKMPNGRVFSKQKGELSTQGASTFSVKLPQNAMTGTYYASILTANNVLIASQNVSVEEFMPDRIKVRLKRVEKNYETTKQQREQVGDSLRIQAFAQNLFGPPAANRSYQMSFNLRQENFVSEKYKDFDFNLDRKENKYLSLQEKNCEGETNEEGKIFQSFYLPKEYQNIGKIKGNVYTTVFDETGRSVTRGLEFDLFTQNAMLGLKKLPFYTSTHIPLNIGMIALSPEEIPTNVNAKIEIVRYRWQTVLEKNYNNELEYASKRKEEIVQEANINIAQISNFNFTPLLSGNYEIRLRLNESDFYVKQEFYAYRNGFTDNASFQVNRDGKIDIQLDKTKYNLNEQAKVLLTTPFDGKMLVTLERENVLQYFYVETKNKVASFELPFKKEHLPNVYITATLIKPVSEGDVPLSVAHGFQSVKVDDENSKINLTIEAIEKTESKTQQTIKVKANRAESDIEVTLAIVDEGILQIKNYQTPNIHNHFYQKRALSVESYDLYPRLFPEFSVGKQATGGSSDDIAGAMRGNPMVNKRVKLVSFWSGILKTNAYGEVSYTINIPQFSGSLRIMAVAYKDGKFGNAEKNMIVADPVVISTGLPRFLSPNDKFTMPIMVMNTTSNDLQASIQVQTSNNLEIKGEVQKTETIKSMSEVMPKYEIVAKPVIDSAKVKVIVTAGGRTYIEELFINIRPTNGLVKMSGSGVLEAGNRRDISFTGDLFPQTTDAKLFISRSPLTQFAQNLEYLIEYPHGCLEQTISGAFPQLYVQDLMKAVKPNLQNASLYQNEIQENIQEALGKIQSLQLYNGGFSYWAGQYEPQKFASVYATHFMVEAKKAGFAVSDYALEQSFDYLKQMISSHNYRRGIRYTFTATENSDAEEITKVFYPKELVYAMYVLTLAQKAEIESMNLMKENIKSLALDSRYLLAACYLLIGEQSIYRELLPTSFEGQYSKRALGGSFHSPIRDEALALNALLEADASNIQISVMAKHLSEKLAQSPSYSFNTQENAMALLALGKLAKSSQNSTAEAIISGVKLAKTQTQNGEILLKNNLFGDKISIEAQGNGKLYYSWALQGLSSSVNNQRKETDKRLKVRRTFYDQEGNVIKNNTFKHNDLVVVKVTITAEPFYFTLDNIVITDMLPAGLEIENPRLTASKTIPWIRNKNEPDHIDMRDDRINFYCNLNAEPKTFYYLTRAVSVGTFQLGQISADAMYSPDYYSYYGAGEIKIIERKKGDM